MEYNEYQLTLEELKLRKQYWDKLFSELFPVLIDCPEQRKNSDKREDLISSRIFLGGSR